METIKLDTNEHNDFEAHIAAIEKRVIKREKFQNRAITLILLALMSILLMLLNYLYNEDKNNLSLYIANAKRNALVTEALQGLVKIDERMHA